MELEEEGSEVERFRSRIAELEREKQMMVYENHASRVEARVKEMEAELATIKARTCKTCSKWYDEYPGSATCAEWSVYSSPSDPQCGENHYAKTRGDGFCYMWVAKKEGK